MSQVSEKVDLTVRVRVSCYIVIARVLHITYSITLLPSTLRPDRRRVLHEQLQYNVMIVSSRISTLKLNGKSYLANPRQTVYIMHFAILFARTGI